MSPTASTSSPMFPVCSDSAYEQTFSMLQASFLNPDVPPSSCLNPYFASYDQELLPCAFSKRGLSGQDPRAPSHFIPTSSNAASISMGPASQIQQAANTQRPRSAASYTVPKDVLHVGEDKPMAREARVARCVACSCRPWVSLVRVRPLSISALPVAVWVCWPAQTRVRRTQRDYCVLNWFTATAHDDGRLCV